MPKAEELAEIVVNGKRYRDWKTVAASRSGQAWFSTCAFSVASPAETRQGWAAQKLRVGDKCQVYLAGVKAIDGEIGTRQPAFNEAQRGLQIIVKSKNVGVELTTADHKPGEFKGYSLRQIGERLLKPTGSKLIVRGSPDGIDKVFPRFNVAVGETVANALTRMMRTRNLFVTDDADGNIVLFRNSGGEGATGELREGANIRAASLIIDNENVLQGIEVEGSLPSNDQRFGNSANRQTGKAENTGVQNGRTLTIFAEMPGDAQDMKMRAEHELAENQVTMVQGQITVQGWLNGGRLWMADIGKNVNVVSDFLFPTGSMMLTINDVTHRQGPEGTMTDIGLVIPSRYGGSGRIDAIAG